MKSVRLAALLSSAALSMTPDMFAQNATSSEDEAAVLDTVIVQAARRDVPVEALPQTVKLIDKVEIDTQSLLSTNLFDIIGQSIPSFSPSRQKLSGRGETFRGREPLYLIDGVPQSNPLRNGDRDGFSIDPAVIERIEVLFGANAIQGPGANSGIINYVTISPEEGEDWAVRTELGTTLSSDIDGDGTGYRGAVTASRDFGQFDLVASFAAESRGAFYDGKGRRIGVDGTQGDIQDSVSTNFFVKAGFDFDDKTRIQGSINLFELEGDGDYVIVPGDVALGTPATSIRGDVEGQAPTNTVETFNLTFERDDLFGGDLEAQVFYRTFESVFGGGTFGGFFNTGLEPAGVETFDQSANNSDKTGAKLTYSHSDLPIEGLTLTGGLDYLEDETFQELIQTGRLWVPETTLKSLAPFIQIDQELLDGRLFVSAGVRYEDAEIEVGDYTTIFSSGAVDVGGGNPSFTETLYNAGASFELVEGVKVYGSYGEVFTLPDVGRVLRAVSTPGLDVDNLLDVQPIVTDNIEIGLSVERGGLSANAAYFESESDFGQRLALNDAGIFTVEREATEISGFELSADYEFADIPLTIGAGYAALEGESDQDGDGSVETELDAVNIGPDRFNIYAAYSFTPVFSGRVQASRFLDREFDDGRDDTDFDGYTLIDVIGSYDFEQYGELQLGIQNLFDDNYTTYFSQASSQAVTNGSRFFQGRGRTYNLRWIKEF